MGSGCIGVRRYSGAKGGRVTRRDVSASVTLVVPCHNYADYVTECVDSVLDQRFGGLLQVIIIDDASTDRSWDVLQRYARESRVVLVRHDHNAGHVATYNEGMARAEGQYVVILSADDMARDRDALSVQTELMERHRSVAFVFSDVDILDERGRTLGRRTLGLPTVIPGAVMFRRLLLENVVAHSGTMVRRSYFEEIGPFDEALVYTHDWDQWLRLTARYDAGFVPRPLYGYRIHGRQLHARDYSRSMSEWLVVLDRACASDREVPPALYRLSLAMGYTARAHAYMARGDFRAGLKDLAAAVRLCPPALLSAEAARGFGHLILGLVLGGHKETLLGLRRRSRS